MGVIDKAVSWAVAIANDDSHKYVWGGWGPHYDCSHFVISAYKQAGVSTGASSTSDMYGCFTKKGFKNVKNSVNTSTGAGLKKGDVLLNTKHHAALVRADGGAIVHASNPTNGICCRNYYNYPKGGWDYVLRYPESSSSTTGTTTAAAKTYTDFPKYQLSESAIRDIATCITGEQGGDDVIACRQEASQIANLNEVTYGRSNTESSIIKTLHGGWYAKSSWNNGCTQKAIEAVKFVLVEGKRVLPRYITEHDMFPLDAAISGHWNNGKNEDRSQYKAHSTTIKQNPSRFKGGGSSYIFYCFFGSKKDKDVAGYYSKDYTKYKSDIPWTEGASEGTASESETAKEKKEITQEKTMAAYGEQMAERKNQFAGRKNAEKDAPDVELYIISHDGVIYKPIIEDGIEWETTYSGTAAQLTFTVIKDENIAFDEGSQVVFKYQGASLFHGFVFKKNRDKDHRIKCTCYDQMRYLQNKNSMVYSDKTATEVIKMIAKDFSLSIGDLVDTAEKIPLRVEDNASLFDIIQYALDYTTWKTGVWYTFYDDFGKLTLKRSTDMKSNCVITQDNAENFDYTSSINESTYTRIKRYYDNTETGVREVYTYDESGKRPQYGVLQLCEKIDDENIEAFRAGAENQMKRELSQYSAPTRNLEIKGVMGDVMVRGGSIVYVTMDLGDIIISSEKSGHYFICDSVKHTFSNDNHTMDVYLTGGGYRFI